MLPCHHATLLSCYPVINATLSSCYFVIMLPCYHATLLSCYPVIMLPCYHATLLSCYPVINATLSSMLPCHQCYPVINVHHGCRSADLSGIPQPRHFNFFTASACQDLSGLSFHNKWVLPSVVYCLEPYEACNCRFCLFRIPLQWQTAKRTLRKWHDTSRAPGAGICI
jgi:hypothetical protein